MDIYSNPTEIDIMKMPSVNIMKGSQTTTQSDWERSKQRQKQYILQKEKEVLREEEHMGVLERKPV